MLSTILELAGFAMVIAASSLVGGLVAGLFVAGAVLVLCGLAADGTALPVQLIRRKGR